MEFYIKQKIFSWRDKFDIYDINENILRRAESEFFSLGKRFHVYDNLEREVIYIEQRILTFLPKYTIFRNGREVTEVKKCFSFFTPHFELSDLPWEVDGDFTSHDYTVKSSGRIIAVISRKWLTWADTYCVNVVNDDDADIVLAIVLIIDAINASSVAFAASSMHTN